MAKRVPLDLIAYGWRGWRLAPYGRARCFRLISPSGEAYTPGEVADVRALQLDVDWLRWRVRELEAATAGARLSVADAETVAAALAVLERLPRQWNQPRTASTPSAILDPTEHEPSPQPIRLLAAR